MNIIKKEDLEQYDNIHFTSDSHFGDERLTLYCREYIGDTFEDIDKILIDNWNKYVGENDIVFHLGDFMRKEPDEMTIDLLKSYREQLNGHITLIKGNYDETFSNSELQDVFDDVLDNALFMDVFEHDEKVFATHKPEDCIPDLMNICGHIHGLWKIQPNMINVGCDNYHLAPIHIDKVDFSINGIKKFYLNDKPNTFPLL